MQHCGIYAGDEDSYIDFADVFDPLIMEYHGLSGDFKHVSDMDPAKVTGNVNPEVPVHSVRLVLHTVLPESKIWSLPFLGLRQGGGRGGAIQGKEGIKFCSVA